MCGKASIEAVRTKSAYDVADDPLRVSPELLLALPAVQRSAQPQFARTGGLHAAALFDAEGALLCLREDVGRHNAFDKVIGWAATQGLLPLRSHMILASGRASFELTQKALMAGIPLLAAVSAPSSLAIELATELRDDLDRLSSRRTDECVRRSRADRSRMSDADRAALARRGDHRE